MRTLLLLRHAKSSWDQPELSDIERPLNKRGEREAPLIGTLLRRQKIVPDQIICSPARRARQTADYVIQSCGYTGRLVVDERLYSTPAQDFAQVLRELPNRVSIVLLVGHNPDMEELASALSGEAVTLATAALAWLRLPLEQWSQFELAPTAELVGIWQAKNLD